MDRDLVITSQSLVPAWVDGLSNTRFQRVTARFEGTRQMDVVTFQQQVVDSYRTVFEQLESTDCPYPVRFWAFVPGIHDDLGAGLDRYMSFNAGRYERSPCTTGGLRRLVADTDGSRSACRGPVRSSLPGRGPTRPAGRKPRQVSSYHYSRRFGPMPPCFARATLLRGQLDRPWLLVGGTASITGEESRHLGDLEAQAGETFRNLASVVAAATGRTLPENAAHVRTSSNSWPHSRN